MITEVYQPEEEKRPAETTAILGPRGTFNEEIALQIRQESAITLVKSIPEVFDAIEREIVNEGLVPLESSTVGAVKQTHTEFSKREGFRITGEYPLPVAFVIYLPKGALATEITQKLSKAEAHEQTRKNTTQLLPNAKRIDVNSTAEAVILAAADTSLTTAAIASKRAAKALDLEDAFDIIPNAQDNPNNITTFVTIKKNGENVPPTGQDKTTYLLTLPDAPGSLYKTLQEISSQANMTKIKSLRRESGEVTFLITVDGHEEDSAIQQIYKAHRERGSIVKSYGSYPKAQFPLPENEQKFDMDSAIGMIKQEIENGNSTDDAVVVFALPNEQGSLTKALQPFAKRGINLTNIDSMACGIHQGYIFYLSFNTSELPNYDEVLQEVGEVCDELRLLPRIIH